MKKTSLSRRLLYGGLTSNEYETLRPVIIEDNRLTLMRFAGGGAAFFAGLLLISFISGLFMPSQRMILALATLSMALFCICTYATGRRNKGLTILLVQIFLIAGYSLAGALSLAEPARVGTAICVSLVLLPMIFAVAPASLLPVSLAAAAVYAVLAVHIKPAETALPEVRNVLACCLLSAYVCTAVQEQRLRLLYQNMSIRHNSETDLLTGVKNRNCYENSIPKYRTAARSRIVCVYADVNGLHELNNTEGHAAGDQMLQTVAREMQQKFGKAHTYRIGGDEFVAFALDRRSENARQYISDLEKSFAGKDIHVSFGLSSAKAAGLRMDRLIKSAETRMYYAKKKYYEEEGHDRRGRFNAEMLEDEAAEG